MIDIALEPDVCLLVSVDVPLLAATDCSVVAEVDLSTDTLPMGASPKKLREADVPKEFVWAVDEPLVYEGRCSNPDPRSVRSEVRPLQKSGAQPLAALRSVRAGGRITGPRQRQPCIRRESEPGP